MRGVGSRRPALSQVALKARKSGAKPDETDISATGNRCIGDVAALAMPNLPSSRPRWRARTSSCLGTGSMASFNTSGLDDRLDDPRASHESQRDRFIQNRQFEARGRWCPSGAATMAAIEGIACVSTRVTVTNICDTQAVGSSLFDCMRSRRSIRPMLAQPCHATPSEPTSPR